jgi:glutamate/tyrosine decarboxylase-like PLP-dependent enzyme
LLGLSTRTIELVAVDANGGMIAADLARARTAADQPTIVCCQAGNVNTGAIDPISGSPRSAMPTALVAC